MLDRLSVDLPQPSLVPDDPAEANETLKVQARFWQHLVRLTAPARRLQQIRKDFAGGREPQNALREGLL